MKSNPPLELSYGLATCQFGNVVIAFADNCVHYLSFCIIIANAYDEIRALFPSTKLSMDETKTKLLTDIIFSKNEPIAVCPHGTPFQIAVWTALQNIPKGTTVSYSQIAHEIGKPNAVRAVAKAIGSNNIAFLIPCHRVISKNGGLAGFKWGLELKKQLLLWETNNL